jgi:D-alanyl-D-alanine carboxypeptidase/D-alanyl-D-alanine-endopeptidase (penicillin-binding protein 4)
MLSVITVRRYLPLVVLAVASLVAWRSADIADIDQERPEPISYDQALATPVFSARRVPRSLQAPIADAAIEPAVGTILSQSTPDTCLIVTANGRLIAEQNPQVPVVPASNEKLITTDVALNIFGPEHQFTTEVRTTGSIVDGVLEGDMYLVGKGDPFLSTDDWWTQFDTQDGRYHTRLEDLADAVAASGITSVNGSLFGDESYFDSLRIGPWAQRLVETRQSGPLSALAVNEGFVSWPAVYAGSFRPRVPTDDPPGQAASTFAGLLAARGVTVSAAGAGVAPGDATLLAELASPPLSELITHINSYSINFGAEILLKHIGRELVGSGSTAAGATAVLANIAERGFDTAGVNITDGSGLSEDTTVTCQLLTDVLLDAGPNSVLANSLSIGGVRGSLIGRHLDSPATDAVYAKTGTLNNVTALSGYVYSPVEPGTTLTFAYVVNGELAGQDERIRALQEPFVDQLATYPAGPPIAELGPLPPIPVPVTAGSGSATGGG